MSCSCSSFKCRTSRFGDSVDSTFHNLDMSSLQQFVAMAVRQELMKYRHMPYVELRRLVDTRVPTLVIKGASGAEYQVVVQVHWEGKRGGDIRIVGLIDDGGWRVRSPANPYLPSYTDPVITSSSRKESHGSCRIDR